MTKPLFSIIRHAKLKTTAHVRAASKHNDRTTPAKHAKPGNDLRPYTLFGPDSTAGLMALHKERVKALKKKPRSNSVMAVEEILTASPDFFNDVNDKRDPKKVEQFVRSAVEWAKKTHGKNLMQMVLHLDETTPHIHCILLPEIDGRLNCREFTARKRLQDLTTSFAEACKPLGLVRGIPRQGASHTALKEFYEHAKGVLGVLPPRPSPPSLNAVARQMPKGKAAIAKYEIDEKMWWRKLAKHVKTLDAKARLYDAAQDIKKKETELGLKARALDELKTKLDMQQARLDGMEGLTLRGKANFIKALPREYLAQAIGIALPGQTEVFDIIRKGGHAKTHEEAIALVLERLAALYPAPTPATPKKTFAPYPVPSPALEPLPTTPYPSTNFGM